MQVTAVPRRSSYDAPMTDTPGPPATGGTRPGDSGPTESSPDDSLPGGTSPRDADISSLPRRLRAAYSDHVGDDERPLLIAWAAFAATFGVTRAITYWLHLGHGPKSGGMTAGGRHLHHYNIGILLLGAVGGAALRGRSRRNSLTATAYGSGAALIIDEAALLIDLKDVYWANDGRRSVDVAVGTIALGGVYLAAVSFWNSAVREVGRSARPKALRRGR